MLNKQRASMHVKEQYEEMLGNLDLRLNHYSSPSRSTDLGFDCIVLVVFFGDIDLGVLTWFFFLSSI